MDLSQELHERSHELRVSPLRAHLAEPCLPGRHSPDYLGLSELWLRDGRGLPIAECPGATR